METRKRKIFRYVRLILMMCVYINQILSLFLPIEGNVYKIISCFLSIGITGLGYWYNNDWTNLAKLATKVIDSVKDGKVDEEDINNLLK